MEGKKYKLGLTTEMYQRTKDALSRLIKKDREGKKMIEESKRKKGLKYKRIYKRNRVKVNR